MSTTVLILFIVTSFVAIATPGPTVLLALSNGARFGLRVALYGMLGAMLSDLSLISAVSISLGAVLAASETAFQILKWVGVIYLLYLGIQLLRTQPKPKQDAIQVSTPIPSHRYRLFLKCLLVALTNPKGYLFFSAILYPHSIVDADTQFHSVSDEASRTLRPSLCYNGLMRRPNLLHRPSIS